MRWEDDGGSESPSSEDVWSMEPGWTVESVIEERRLKFSSRIRSALCARASYLRLMDTRTCLPRHISTCLRTSSATSLPIFRSTPEAKPKPEPKYISFNTSQPASDPSPMAPLDLFWSLKRSSLYRADKAAGLTIRKLDRIHSLKII
jgi:hypothetical protein